MIVHLNNKTYRVQFIKVVESRKNHTDVERRDYAEVEPKLRQHGKTTIKTICKIFVWGEKVGRVDGWVPFSESVARQNPVDKYNHMVGKRVALQKAMIKDMPEVKIVEPEHRVFAQLSEFFQVPEPVYYFDRVERSYFASRLEAEFSANG